MGYFIPEQDITHIRARGIFTMEQRADGTVQDVNWRFSQATFDADGRVDENTHAVIQEKVFAVGRTHEIPGVLWTACERYPLQFAVRDDKLDAVHGLDPDGMELIALGPLWDREAKTFCATPSFSLVNNLRRADGWDADKMVMTPYPFRGDHNDIRWMRNAPGYVKSGAVGGLPMYQDLKTRELVINDAARTVLMGCDAPSVFFTELICS